MTTAPTVPAAVPLPIRYLDVLLIVALAPFALLAGLPVVGYLAGAGAWIAQRVIGARIEAKAYASGDPKRVLGIGVAGAMGRAWAMGAVILAVGLLVSREDGLTAAVLVAVAFTVYLVLSVRFRPHRTTS